MAPVEQGRRFRRSCPRRRPGCFETVTGGEQEQGALRERDGPSPACTAAAMLLATRSIVLQREEGFVDGRRRGRRFVLDAFREPFEGDIANEREQPLAGIPVVEFEVVRCAAEGEDGDGRGLGGVWVIGGQRSS